MKDKKQVIEEIFAEVAGSTPEKHKNELGDKWKYIDAIHDKLIPTIQKAEREGIMSEYETLFQFAENVAMAMDKLKSSHVFFIIQQAFGDEDWRGSQDILDTVIAQSKALKGETNDKPTD